MILILDYGCGNILSLKRALDEIGLKNLVSNAKEEIINADLIILPGVGAFENAIDLLKKKGLFDIILNEVSKQKPLIGICLGMQMLFTKSFEMGEHLGLNLIEGNCFQSAYGANLSAAGKARLSISTIRTKSLRLNRPS